MSKVATKSLEELESSIDDLEDALEPLLAQPLPNTMANFDLMQKSKMNVLLAYAIEDLVWIYLKSRGIDPNAHPVSEDLARIKSYFGKIKQVENPDKRTMAIDKAAAGRFIRAAIASASKETKKTEQPSTSAEVPQVGKHTRFAHVAAETEKITPGEEPASDAESSSSSEEEGEVDPIVRRSKKGKQREKGVMMSGSAISKKRRPAMDPFAGYEDDTKQQAKKKSKKASSGEPSSGGVDSPEVEVIDVDMEDESEQKESSESKSGSPVDTSSPSEGGASSKSKKKKKKKAAPKQE